MEGGEIDTQPKEEKKKKQGNVVMGSLDPICSRVIMSMESNLPLSADIPDNGVSVEGGEKKVSYWPTAGRPMKESFLFSL